MLEENHQKMMSPHSKAAINGWLKDIKVIAIKFWVNQK